MCPVPVRPHCILRMQSQYTRNSVRYTNQGDILIPASKYVCVFNKKGNSQTFYTGHGNEMSCVAVSKVNSMRCDAMRSAAHNDLLLAIVSRTGCWRPLPSARTGPASTCGTPALAF